MATGELHPEPAPEARTEDSGLRTEEGWRGVLLVSAALAVLVSGASPWFLLLRQEDLTGTGVYHGTGVVLAIFPAPSQLDAERPVVILQHDPIPDLMDKGMTHPFLVRSERLLRGIGAGTRVRFTLKDTPGALLVVRLEAIP